MNIQQMTLDSWSPTRDSKLLRKPRVEPNHDIRATYSTDMNPTITVSRSPHILHATTHLNSPQTNLPDLLRMQSTSYASPPRHSTFKEFTPSFPSALLSPRSGKVMHDSHLLMAKTRIQLFQQLRQSKNKTTTQVLSQDISAQKLSQT